MHLFGLTGGIATGKSTVAAHLRSRGLPVIDADELSREVVAPGTDGLREVVAAFGQAILAQDGTLDRPALARIVFADDEARRRLNALIHPRIRRRVGELAAGLSAAGEPLGCYEAALIVESGSADRFRPLVVVACPEDVQLARVRARGGASERDALARIRSQLPMALKIAAADYVIDTSGPLEESARRTDAVLQAICRSLHVDRRRFGLEA
ncbi:MAG TPA: dephospho-CoA kinase [Polyangiaceae bacterium]|nr:dephospho-CoA kinase [Polyangiaceae bacterium]